MPDCVLTLAAVRTGVRDSEFDLAGFICGELGDSLRDGDVLVVSSKLIATSEGRTVPLARVRVGRRAAELSAKYRMDSKLCELVLRESDFIVGGLPGFLMAVKDGLLAPNAGIDKSNVEHGAVVMYPRRPEASAWRIREAVMLSIGRSVGVVVCDSRLSPTRRGTVGVAVAASGIEAIVDLRGKEDLFGNVLKVTTQAVADDLSSAAEVLMGESDEGAPIVLVRGLSKSLVRKGEYPSRRFAISIADCVYMRSLGYGGPG